MPRPTGRKLPLAVRLSERLYAALLVIAYPQAFRDEYGRDMREMFRDRCAAEAARSGWGALPALPRLWVGALRDALRNGRAARAGGRAGVAYRPWREASVDTRIALRTLRKTPGFTVVALLTLALGIGATTAVFSVFDTVWLAELPYPQADRLLMVWRYDTPVDRIATFSYPDIVDIDAASESLSGVAPIDDVSVVVGRGTEGRRVPAARVSKAFFEVLGVQPLLGRGIEAADEPRGAAPVVVIGYELWQREFNGDPGVLGEPLRIDSMPWTVVGVMPRNFSLPPTTELWVPLRPAENRNGHFLAAVGRLAPGATTEEAEAEVSGIIARLEQEHPNRYVNNTARVVSLKQHFSGDAVPTLRILGLAVAAVLLIGCVNIANLLLARSSVRRREMAVRAAIGASRGRVVRQLITESLVLAVGGGLLGVAVAFWTTRALMSFVPADGVPFDAAINFKVLTFSAAVTLATGLLFGIFPAFRVAAGDLNATLKDESGATAGSRRSGGRSLLVVAEVGLAVALLFSAGLMMRSVGALLDIDIGFGAEETWVVNLDIPIDANVPDFDPLEARAQVVNFYRDLRTEVASMPGVEDAGLVTYLPFSGLGWGTRTMVHGQPVVPRPDRYLASWNIITPGYFETLGVPLTRGRLFRDSDEGGGELVVVINETLARTLWPTGDPIGARITNEEPDTEEWLTVIGIVADHRDGRLTREIEGQVFLVNSQFTETSMSLVFRAPELGTLGPAVRDTIRELDPRLTVPEVRPLSSYIDRQLAPTESLMAVMGVFAALAMSLAAIGTYGVMSYSVSQRVHELGVRRALGAQTGDVVALVARQGMGLATLGVALGLAGGWAAGRVLEGVLYGVRPSDPWNFAAVGLVAAAIALAACLVPARRASRVDPLVALRSD